MIRFGLRVGRGSRLAKWLKKNHLRLLGVLKTKPILHRKITMYDSIFAKNLPRNAKAVLGYVGGRYPTYTDGTLFSLFPDPVRKMGIAVFASLDAKALDIERYDASPDQAALWVKRQHKRGEKHPVLYIAASGYQPLVDLLRKSGLKFGKDYYVVTAHYTFKEHICGPKTCGYGKQSAHGTQWTDKAVGNAGARVDQSLVLTKIFK